MLQLVSSNIDIYEAAKQYTYVTVIYLIAICSVFESGRREEISTGGVERESQVSAGSSQKRCRHRGTSQLSCKRVRKRGVCGMCIIQTLSSLVPWPCYAPLLLPSVREPEDQAKTLRVVVPSSHTPLHWAMVKIFYIN